VHIVLDLQACQSFEARRRGIGRYSLALAKAMALHPRGHDISLLLNANMGGDSVEYLRGEFDGLLPQSRIVAWDCLTPAAYAYGVNAFRRQASEVLRREILRRLKPDVVHVASIFDGAGDDAVSTIPAGERYISAVTLYDLIPLVHQQTYLSDETLRRGYMEKVGYLKQADLLLGISQFSCDEAAELLGIPQERLVNISGAADATFQRLENPDLFRRELTSRYGLTRPFIMYAGGFDARKNIGSLIRAFALLPETLRRGHQLVIVGGAPESERVALSELMVSVGVAPSEVVFTGYVPDSDLVKLYNLCALYVFPSLQEGFGLPALEAMSSGAIVIGSNTSSLPEVIGHDDALFDPRDPHAIKNKMVQALTDSQMRAALSRHGVVQPLKFSWQESARRVLTAFEAAMERGVTQQHARGAQAGRKAALSTQGSCALLPAPDSDGVAAHDAHDVVVYADGDCSGIETRHSLGAFAAARESFDRIIIEITDHPYCAKTLPFAQEGAVDLIVRGTEFGVLLNALAASASGRELVLNLVYRSGGYPGLFAAVSSNYSPKVLARIFDPTDFQSLGSAQVIDGVGATSKIIAGKHWRDEVRAIVTEIAGFEKPGQVSESDWRRVATAISQNLPAPRSAAKQWLVDISNLFVQDAGTGIQRVVRHVLDELIKSPPKGYRIEAVCLGVDGIFRYARSYCARRYFPGETLPPDDPVEFAAGDVYLSLDLIAHLMPPNINRFRDLRNRGVEQHFVVYDLLPLLRPDCFKPPVVPPLRAWYEAVAEVADSVMCISRAVADEFRVWLDQARPVRHRPLNIGYFHLGADLAVPAAHTSAAVGDTKQLADLGGRTTFLMVGTIEPRKAHAQVLAAFEQLWSAGRDVNLLIVGRAGWLVDDLLRQLRKHPERGTRLFWYEEAPDDLLLAAYAEASALIMASEGEGFGLPLIEAAHHGLPLIVRDLPVFREIAEDHAHYFSGFGADDLAHSLDEWLRLHEKGSVPRSDGMRWATWQESTRQLVDHLLGKRWLHSWTVGPEWRHAAYDYRFKSEIGKLVHGRLESTGTPGLLLYGLPLKLQVGRYLVKLYGGWHSHAGHAGLEICSHAGDVMHVRQNLNAAVEPTSGCIANVELTIESDVSDLEIRVRVDEGVALWISELIVRPLQHDEAVEVDSLVTGLSD
jgi:glycosyltransferase involved in cell wall biosynthesis